MRLDACSECVCLCVGSGGSGSEIPKPLAT